MAGDRRVKILIPAAGESRRFREAGYDTLKPFLRIKYGDEFKSMLGHVIERAPAVPIIIGTRNTKYGGLPSGAHVTGCIIEHTSGQADTVLQMLHALDPDDEGPIVTMDCDTLVERSAILYLIETLKINSASVLVAKNNDPAMSRVDHVPYPSVFVEKKSISQWGIVSVRGFNNARVLRETLAQVVSEHETVGTEPYMSHVLNRYPGIKRAVTIKNYVDWGTPDKLIMSGALIEEDE